MSCRHPLLVAAVRRIPAVSSGQAPLRAGGRVERRAARAADIPGMADLIGRCTAGYRAWAPVDWTPPADIIERDKGRLRERLHDPGVRAEVAFQVGRLAAFGVWEPSRDELGVASLWLLFVEPQAWGTGLGRRLLQTAERSMRDAAFHEAELSVAVANVRARRFYARNRWDATDESWVHPVLGFKFLHYRKPLVGREGISAATG